jgi:hypothetical protein
MGRSTPYAAALTAGLKCADDSNDDNDKELGVFGLVPSSVDNRIASRCDGYHSHLGRLTLTSRSKRKTGALNVLTPPSWIIG